MMLCFSKTRKIKYFLDPPPQKKRLKDTNGRGMSTRTSDRPRKSRRTLQNKVRIKVFSEE